MTPEQIELVHASFAQLLPNAEAVAALFYARLFELDPRLRGLFQDDLAAQGHKLMSTLRLAVASLDQLEALCPVVKALGRRHARYGVTPDDYDTVAEALLWSLARCLGAGFTPPVEQAWTALYTRLAGIMQAGAIDQPGPCPGELVYAESSSAASGHRRSA